MSDYREVERKLTVDVGWSLPPLDTVKGVERVEEAPPIELDAVYFDTADLRLAIRGVTLRRRTGGSDAGWHLKLPAPGGARTEVRRPLADSDDVPPDSLAELVVGLARGAPLALAGRIWTTRHTRTVYGTDGAAQVEVADDHVVGQALGDEPSEERWREIEVELLGDDESMLQQVVDLLLEAGARPAESASKLARVLGADVLARHAVDLTLPVDPTAGEVATAYLREHVGALTAWDPEVRRDTYDSVHKARVAARRLRSALRIYRPLLDRAVTDPIRDELQWLGTVLGKARDLEVMKERLLGRLDQQPPELVIGPVRERITVELGGGYADAHRAAVEEMSGERYLNLLTELDTLAADPPLVELAQEPAGTVLPELARRSWKRIRSFAEAAENESDPEQRDLALHEVRKAAKMARYAGESMQPVYGDDATAFAAAMESVQEVLGTHQDGVVTRGALREMGVRAQSAGENAFTYGLLAGIEEAQADQAMATYADTWRRASRKRLRSWMAYS